MQLDWNIILNSSIGAGIILIGRELLMQYLSDRLQAGTENRRKVAEELLLYCSNAEAHQYISTYDLEKQTLLQNQLSAINDQYGEKFSELTSLLTYNDLANQLQEDSEFSYKDKAYVKKEIKKSLNELKLISKKLKK